MYIQLRFVYIKKETIQLSVTQILRAYGKTHPIFTEIKDLETYYQHTELNPKINRSLTKMAALNPAWILFKLRMVSVQIHSKSCSFPFQSNELGGNKIKRGIKQVKYQKWILTAPNAVVIACNKDRH